MTHRGTFAGFCAVGALLVGVGGAPARADAVEDFYKNARMSMYIGYTAGGGYDRYARLLARHMERHIPGKPNIVPRQYTGAGGLRVANSIFNVFPQDGTAIGAFGRQSPLEALTGNKKAKFVGNEFNWIGSANREYSVCAFWHTSPIKTTDDLFKKGPIVGGNGAGSGTDIQAMMLNNLIGTKLTLITGFPGGVDINLAMERGEVHGRCAWSWSSVVATQADWVKDKKIVFPLQIAAKAHPDLKDVPLVGKFIKNDRDRQILDVVLAPLTIGRPYAVGPRVPTERVEALRAAFDANMKDEKFRAEAEKGRLPIDPADGKEVQALMDKLYALPPDIIKGAGDAISHTNNIEISQARIPVTTVMGNISKVQREGRSVSWSGEGKKGKLSVGGKTKVMVAGKAAKRGMLKAGMECSFKVRGAQQALAIDCK
ncbi:MAG: Bug family tripartite tricarboxylate transporter substrate binding protein [Alphaproteobacteria bacterium]